MTDLYYNLEHVPTEYLAKELAERLQANVSGSIIPGPVLQSIGTSCEIELTNRMMDMHGYYND